MISFATAKSLHSSYWLRSALEFCAKDGPYDWHASHPLHVEARLQYEITTRSHNDVDKNALLFTLLYDEVC